MTFTPFCLPQIMTFAVLALNGGMQVPANCVAVIPSLLRLLSLETGHEKLWDMLASLHVTCNTSNPGTVLTLRQDDTLETMMCMRHCANAVNHKSEAIHLYHAYAA